MFRAREDRVDMCVREFAMPSFMTRNGDGRLVSLSDHSALDVEFVVRPRPRMKGEETYQEMQQQQQQNHTSPRLPPAQDYVLSSAGPSPGSNTVVPMSPAADYGGTGGGEEPSAPGAFHHSLKRPLVPPPLAAVQQHLEQPRQRRQRRWRKKRRQRRLLLRPLRSRRLPFRTQSATRS